MTHPWPALLGASWLVVIVACAPIGTPYRALHEVDGQLVESSPPAPSAYEAYLRSRMALEQQPPQLESAQYYIELAIRSDPRDPHLWSTRAEIEEKAGKLERAATSARRALTLRPGYPPAERVLARLEGGAPAASTGVVAPRQP